MSSPKKPTNDDEDKFNETVKRMLETPPKPHKPKSKHKKKAKSR